MLVVVLAGRALGKGRAGQGLRCLLPSLTSGGSSGGASSGGGSGARVRGKLGRPLVSLFPGTWRRQWRRSIGWRQQQRAVAAGSSERWRLEQRAAGGGERRMKEPTFLSLPGLPSPCYNMQ